MNETRKATIEYEAELDEATADLIRNGVPPWNAAIKAVEIVRNRRAIRRMNEKRGDNHADQSF